MQPKTTHPEVTHSEATHPEATHPEATHPEATHPEATHPEATHPEATHPEATHPEATHPEMTHPEATHPEATHPEMTNPKITNPKSILPKVLVVGSGGVGSIAALALTTNGKSETTLVVRSDYDQVMKSGYTVHSVTYGELRNWRPKHVSPSVEEAAKEFGPFDYVVLTTKNIPDGGQTCEDIIRPAVSESTTIVLIQNGIGVERPMIEQFPKSVILSGVSIIGSSNINCVINNIGKDQILLSPFHNPNVAKGVAEEKVKEFTSIYQNVDESINKIHIEADSRRSRWEKLLYNCVMNTTCAITGIDVNRCQINGANKDLLEPAMDEVLAIAASDGVHLAQESKQKFLHIGDGSFYSPSMLLDLQKNQLMEIEVILGNTLRIARANRVQTPILSVMYSLLKMKQFKIMESKGLVKVDEVKYKGRNSDDYPEIFASENVNH